MTLKTLIQKLSSGNAINQWAHIGWGALITLSFAIHGQPILGLIVSIFVSIVKEFLIEGTWKHLSWEGDSTDFLFWTIGALLGFTIQYM